MQSVLKDIICFTFENEVGRWGGNPHGKQGPQRALQMVFAAYNGRKNYKVELIIYAPMNYIGVHSRVLNDDGVPTSEWACHAYHDCEWRYGVNDFLHIYDHIRSLDSVSQPWYKIIFLGDEMRQALQASHH